MDIGIEMRDGLAMVASLTVTVKKQHKHVLRDVENLMRGIENSRAGISAVGSFLSLNPLLKRICRRVAW
jgi:hypothetical protein